MLSSLFSTKSNKSSKISAPTNRVQPTQYNKVTTGESFEGEKELVSTVFTPQRLDKMKRLACNHQEALSASDIIDLRKTGITFNKTLVSEYSRYCSQKQQAGEESDTFVNWLNIKTNPSMMEAPSMYVLQFTQPGKAVNKVAIGEFGPSGIHFNLSAQDNAVQENVKTTTESMNVAAEDTVCKINTTEGTANDYLSEEQQVKLINDASNELLKAHAELAKQKQQINHLEAKLSAKGSHTTKEDEEHDAALIHKAADEIIMYKKNQKQTTEVMEKAAEALKVHQGQMAVQQNELDAIKKHLKSTNVQASAVGRHKRDGTGAVASHVKDLCNQLMHERERNEALMAQTVCESDVDSGPLLKKASDQLSKLNRENKSLKYDNDVFAKDTKDMQATIDHLRKIIKTYESQNLHYKQSESRATYQKEMHRNNAAIMGQRLGAALDFHCTEEDGARSAAGYILAAKDGCDCEKFEDHAYRQEMNGALVFGSTDLMPQDLKYGQRAKMDIHNAFALTDKSGEVVNEVEVERMCDLEDGTMRARLLTPLMLGKNTIQSEMRFGEDHYQLVLNSR